MHSALPITKAHKTSTAIPRKQLCHDISRPSKGVIPTKQLLNRNKLRLNTQTSGDLTLKGSHVARDEKLQTGAGCLEKALNVSPGCPLVLLLHLFGAARQVLGHTHLKVRPWQESYRVYIWQVLNRWHMQRWPYSRNSLIFLISVLYVWAVSKLFWTSYTLQNI